MSTKDVPPYVALILFHEEQYEERGTTDKPTKVKVTKVQVVKATPPDPLASPDQLASKIELDDVGTVSAYGDVSTMEDSKEIEAFLGPLLKRAYRILEAMEPSPDLGSGRAVPLFYVHAGANPPDDRIKRAVNCSGYLDGHRLHVAETGTNMGDWAHATVGSARSAIKALWNRLWSRKRGSPGGGEPSEATCIQEIIKYKYAVIVDCGSSGSRAYVYQWQTVTQGEIPKVTELIPSFKPDNSRLSAIEASDNDDEKTIYDRVEQLFEPLLNFAKRKIETAIKQCVVDRWPNVEQDWVAPGSAEAFLNGALGGILEDTHLFVGATGGMRSLEIGKRSRIEHLANKYIHAQEFRLANVRYKTISGQAEGIFGWLAANYEKDAATPAERFPLPPIPLPPPTHARSKGYVEMGGQTMQMAFMLGNRADLPEPPNDRRDRHNLRNAQQKYIRYIKLSHQETYPVFAYCWENHGADAQWKKRNETEAGLPNELSLRNWDPCKPKALWAPAYNPEQEFRRCLETCERLLRSGLQLTETHVHDGPGCLLHNANLGIPATLHDYVLQRQPKRWVGGSNFHHGAGGVYRYNDVPLPAEYDLLHLLRQSHILHTKEREDLAPEHLASATNRGRVERAAFLAVYTSLTLHQGFRIPMVQGEHELPLLVGQEIFDGHVGALRHRATGNMQGVDIRTGDDLLVFFNQLAVSTLHGAGPHGAVIYETVDPDVKPWAMGAAIIFATNGDARNCLDELIKDVNHSPVPTY